MSLLLELAQEVHQFAGRREPVDDWRTFCRERVPELRATIGDHTVTTMGRYPRRFVDAKTWCRIGGQRLEHMWEAEPRSRYIDACNGGKTRSRWAARDHDAMEAIRGAEIPHYRKAGMPTAPVVCIDLDAAYWAFAQHFSTQVEYRPESGSWAPVGEPWQDMPTLMRAKVLRSTICTVAWHNRFGAWYDKGERHETRSPYYQPQAYRLLSDYLMSVAEEVIGLFDPWAVNNDGYVIEEPQAAELAEFLQDRWGVSSKVEKRWSPGEDWPWVDKHPRCAVRHIPDIVRQRLAWHMTGEGPRSGLMLAVRAETGELEFTMPAEQLEPEPQPWQARRGLTRWQLLEVELPARYEWRHPGQVKGRAFCSGLAAAEQAPSDTAEYVEPVRGPPQKEKAPPGRAPSNVELLGSGSVSTVPDPPDMSTRLGLAAARAALFGSSFGSRNAVPKQRCDRGH